MSAPSKGPWSIDRWGTVRDGNGERLLVEGVALPNANHFKIGEANANARLLAASPELVQVVRGFVADHATLAAEFQAATGFVAPGHDVTDAALSAETRETCRREWVKWLANRAHRQHEEALAALEKAGVTP